MTTLDIAFNSLKKAQNWGEATARFPGLENAILEGLRSENAKNGESAPKAEQSSANEQVEAQNPNMTWRRALLGQGEAHDPGRALREAKRAIAPSPKVGVIPSIANRAKDMFRQHVIDPMTGQPKEPVQEPVQTPVEPTPKAPPLSPYT